MAEKKHIDSRRLYHWLAIVAMFVLVLYLLLLWYRWLRPDPAFLEFTASIVEILAIASFLGLQTEIGQRFVFRIDETFIFKQVLNTPKRVCIASWSATILAALVLHIGSPAAANAYRARGVTAIENGEYSLGIRSFQQAISLEPNNARSHYNLALAYEALYEYEAAIDEYQTALEYGETFWPTYNNLGRLLISAKGDSEAGLAILLDGYRRTEDQISQAVIQKNTAWAYAELGFTITALGTLEDAIRVLQASQSEGESMEIYLAESYALQADLFARLGDDQSALVSRQNSLGYALAVSESSGCSATEERLPQYCVDAIRWAAEARENMQFQTGEE
jgi:hypothetical protein